MATRSIASATALPGASALLNLLGDVLDARQTGICLYDSTGRVLGWNRTYLTLYPELGPVLKPGVLYRECIQHFLQASQDNIDPVLLEQQLQSALQFFGRQQHPYIVQHQSGHWIGHEWHKTADGYVLDLAIDLTGLSSAENNGAGGTVSIGAAMTELKQREKELARSTAMLRAISYAAASLIGDPDWEGIVEELLARLGQATDVSRVVLFQIEHQADRQLAQTCRFEWAAAGVEPIKHSPSNQAEVLTATDASGRDWMRRRQHGEIVQAKVRELSGYMHDKFAAEGILSLVTVPVMVRGQLWGHIDFDDCQRERVWSEVDVEVLRTAAMLLAATMEKTHIDAELRASEERFRTIAEALPVLISRYDDGCLLYVSPSAGDMLGYAVGDLIGRPIETIYRFPEQRIERFNKFKRQGFLDDEEITLSRGDGQPLTAAVTVRQIVYGGVSALLGALTDLTERKSVEVQLARQREALHQADKMSALGSLLAGVSHELNNPLAVLVGQAIMLEEDVNANDALKVRVGKIRNAADRCARIVKTFLAMARQRSVEYSDTRLEPLIDAVLDLIGYSIRSSGVEVQRDLDPDLPTLWTDPDQLSQLLLNLAINAQQALLDIDPPRRLRVGARFERQPGQIVLEVADNGPGVPKELQQRIFEPFYTTKPVGQGTGIGLALCHSIVMMNGGSITVDDAPEGGALFRVFLPVDETPRTAQAVTTPESAPMALPEPATMRPILIVDDEPSIAELLAEILQEAGFSTMTAHSGRQALKCLSEQEFALILSDIRMPDLDGPGLLRALEQTYPAMCQRLIFITGDVLSSADSLVLSKKLPVLEKPFDPDEVQQRVVARLAELTRP